MFQRKVKTLYPTNLNQRLPIRMLLKYLPDTGAFDTIPKKRLGRKNIFWKNPKKQHPRPKPKPKAMGAGLREFGSVVKLTLIEMTTSKSGG